MLAAVTADATEEVVLGAAEDVAPPAASVPVLRTGTLSRGRFWLLTGSVIAATFLFRVWFGQRGYYVGDDFLLRNSATQPLSFDYLFAGHNGHLNPIGSAVQWLLQRLFPDSYLALVLFSAACVAGFQVACAAISDRLSGPRWLGVFVAAFAGLSLFTLELITWWSVAIYAAPLLLSAGLALYFCVRAMESGIARDWLFMLVAVAAAFLSGTKGLLLPVLIFVVVASLPVGRPVALGYRAALVRFRWLWLGLVIAVAMFAWFSASRQPFLSNDGATPATIWRFLVDNTYLTADPIAWGGPWRWAPIGTPELPGWHAAPAPTRGMQDIAAGLSLVAVAVTVAWRPKAIRLLAGVGGYVLLSVLLVALGRAGSMFAAPMIRYIFDLVLPCTLVLAYVLAPTRWEVEPLSVRGARVASWLTEHRSVRRAATGVLLLAAAVSLLVSYSVPISILSRVPTRLWLDNARAGFPQVADGTLLAQPAPSVLSGSNEPLAWYLAGVSGAPTSTELVFDRLQAFDTWGRLREQHVKAWPSPTGPVPGCGYPLQGDASTTVRLGSVVEPGLNIAELGYYTKWDVTVQVVLDGPGSPPRQVRLIAGLHRAYFPLAGSGEKAELSIIGAGGPICVTGLAVGPRDNN